MVLDSASRLALSTLHQTLLAVLLGLLEVVMMPTLNMCQLELRLRCKAEEEGIRHATLVTGWQCHHCMCAAAVDGVLAGTVWLE